MPDESRLLKKPTPIVPIERKAFRGVVKPGVITQRGSSLRNPEKGETTPLPIQRVEAGRQWCVKQNTTQSLQVAEILVEQFHRLNAIRQVVEEKMPDGQMKEVFRQLCDGRLIAIPG